MIFGREVELKTIGRAITDARLGKSSVMVVRGEAGIGKTALLEAAAATAREEGMEGLAAGGVEREAEVPFGGLLELLRPALGALERIPAAQATALRSALDLGPTEEADRFVIGAATLNLLSAHSEHAPLLVLADDAQWLDDSSVTAPPFAARPPRARAPVACGPPVRGPPPARRSRGRHFRGPRGRGTRARGRTPAGARAR